MVDAFVVFLQPCCAGTRPTTCSRPPLPVIRVALAMFVVAIAGCNCTQERDGEAWRERMDAIGRRMQVAVEYEVFFLHARDEWGTLVYGR